MIVVDYVIRLPENGPYKNIILTNKGMYTYFSTLLSNCA